MALNAFIRRDRIIGMRDGNLGHRVAGQAGFGGVDQALGDQVGRRRFREHVRVRIASVGNRAAIAFIVRQMTCRAMQKGSALEAGRMIRRFGREMAGLAKILTMASLARLSVVDGVESVRFAPERRCMASGAFALVALIAIVGLDVATRT